MERRKIRVYVEEAGPLKNQSYEILLPGTALFIGSNISGKTLAGIMSSSTLLLTINYYRELVEALGFETYEEEELPGVDLLLQMISRYDPLGLREYVSHDELLDIIKDVYGDDPIKNLYRYLYTCILLSELNLVFDVSPGDKRKRKRYDIKYYLEIENCLKINVSLRTPIIDPMKDLLDQYVRVEYNCEEKYLGLALLEPYNSYKRIIYPDKSRSPSEEIVARITANGSNIHGKLVGEIQSLLAKTLSLSGLPIERGEKIKIRPSLPTALSPTKIKIGENIIEEHFFSKGLRVLFSHAVYISAMYELMSKYEVSPIVYLDEPEASLDTYIVYNLLDLYLSLINDLNVPYAIMISSHREEILHKLELMISRDILKPDNVYVYEIVWKDLGRISLEKRVFDKALERYSVRRLEDLLLEI